MVIFDAVASLDRAADACRRLKADSFTGVIPALMLVRDDQAALERAFALGADEVLRVSTVPQEVAARELTEARDKAREATEGLERNVVLAAERIDNAMQRLEQTTTTVTAALLRASSGLGDALTTNVERIQIEGKNLFKFGGDVGGSLENWGFSATDVDRGDLRLVRQGNTLHAYSRPDERSPWSEVAPAQPAPKTMARVLKFGVKLSAETNLSAQVRWVDLTMNGQVIRSE